MIDPFGTARLRAAVLAAWRDSPTRLVEDTAAEADLVAAGYRDRVLTELAQNAADAATRAGAPGTLTVRLADGALRVANTGAPLDADGVASLGALRASAKTSGVGRFGVGFTAVLAVSDAPEVLSRSGSVAFSAERTRAEVRRSGIGTRGPTLRMVWPSERTPQTGDTEVVLPLRDGVDGAVLLAAFAAEAADLLLELTGLASIDVDGRVLTREVRPLGPGLDEVTVDGRTWWQSSAGAHRWLVELVDGEVRAAGPDVLRAPTRTDEELDLPARLIADLAVAPDRRRLLPGTPLDGLAAGYVPLVAALPAEQRTRLVPARGLPRGPVDDVLRTQLHTALRTEAWLPAATGDDVAARVAVVLDRSSNALVAVLAEVVPGLAAAELSGPAHTAALAALDVPRLSLAGVVESVAGLGREPAWWRELYTALDGLVHDRADLAELAALAVPLADGRTVLGPHTVLVTDVEVDLPGLRVVHPAAVHPLLVRLGAREAGPAELLDDPALAEAVAHIDPDDPAAAAELAGVVLTLVAQAGSAPAWAGELLLPDDDGELRAADELLLPGAPLAAVLAPDSPFETLAAEVLASHGPEVLRRIGVGWGFTVLTDDDAAAPGHDLDDEDAWWQQCTPSRVHAVRDLDLVDPHAWPAALTLLHTEPDTLAAVREPNGHTAWWLRRNAELDGVALGHWRAPADDTFAGLLDPAPVAVDPVLLAAATISSDALAQVLLERLADPARHPGPAAVTRAHTALADALTDGALDLDALDPPERVRTLDGSVVEADAAVVLDRAWLAQVLPPARLVLGALGPDAAVLAELLDLGLASDEVDDEVDAEVVSVGEPVAWADDPAAVLACAQRGVAVPAGVLLRHDELRISGAERPLDFWVDGAGVHAGPHGLLAALAHVLA